MSTLHCLVATTQKHLDDALRVRWTVFGSELGLLSTPPPALREVHCFDTLETTLHFIVYDNQRPVATARLLLPNAEVALTTGLSLGIDLEQKLDLSALCVPDLRPAETTRYCVLRRWRGSEALLLLNAVMYQESRHRGVSHWVAAANMETDSLDDARLVCRVAAHEGLVSQRWRVEPRIRPEGPTQPVAPLYSPQQRQRAHEGLLEGLRLPRTLGLFSRKLGARFVGDPVYDTQFRRYALPLVAALDDIPPSTLALFEALTASPQRVA
ncbi:acetyltransferase (GNAT) family protein [Archangium gephyra]|uniref:Acetyltransferase (GNAT) family protein n=1 Tax=Archangium gephyra TaxID=48 RepID=A0AAC8TEH4_9BACT|nr:GNAT family N-acetyltransferase [Archangium gephyra]AKJ02970.1 Hypothetical protein AA314_04596 [Archangium gephyra]REG25095.1 acetyltransferase (GNAT) family protein [Archangium gephyra]